MVTSFDPDDIKVEKLKWRGAVLLRAYLEFARSGEAALSRSNRSEVEAGAVARHIQREVEAAGWKAQLNVGLGAFRVDVGIENPDVPGELLLGVACDGAQYISAKTARDRDRLRPFVLNRLGWRLVRVWSPDFAANPSRVVSNVLTRAQSALDEARARSEKQIASDPPLFENAQEWGEMWIEDDAPASSLELEEEDDDEEEAIAGVAFVPVELEYQGTSLDFDALVESNSSQIREAFLQVVNGEGPVSSTTATRRVIAAWGMSRAGSRLQNIVLEMGKLAARDGLVKIKSEGKTSWYWPPEMDTPEPRVPADEWNVRHQDEICLEELAEGAAHIVASCFSIGRQELLVQTARLFGFKQTGRLVSERIGAALAVLEGDERVSVEDNRLVWKIGEQTL